MSRFLTNLVASFKNPRRSRGWKTTRRRTVRPRFEQLEGRLVPTLANTSDFLRVDPVNVNNDSFGPNQTVARADNGNFAVVWTEGGTEGGVFTRVFNGTGTPLTDPTHVNGTDGRDINATVAMNGSGEFALAWTRKTTDTDTDVYAQKFYANGDQGAWFLGVAHSAAVEDSPSVGIDATGNFVVAYRQKVGSTGQIRAAFYNYDNSERRDIAVAGTATQNQYEPIVSMNGAGRCVVAYTRDYSAIDSDVQARVLDSNGNTLTDVISVAVTDLKERSPSASINLSGQFVVGYTYVRDELDLGPGTTPIPETDVYASRFDANGVRLASTAISTTNVYEDRTSVSLDDRGNYAVAYDVNGSPGDASNTVYARTIDSHDNVEATGITIPVTLNGTATKGNLLPSVALDKNGGATLAWSNLSTLKSQLYVQTFKTTSFRIDPPSLPGGQVELTNGTSQSITLTIRRDTGFSGPVDLSVTGILPAGLHWSVSPANPSNPAVETRTLTFTADATLSTDRLATVKVHAQSGSLPQIDLPVNVRFTALQITDVNSASGAPHGQLVPGTTIRISGKGFTPGSKVEFDLSDAFDRQSVNPVAIDGTTIAVVVPDDVRGGHSVHVRTPGGGVADAPIDFSLSWGGITHVSSPLPRWKNGSFSADADAAVVGYAPIGSEPGTVITIEGYGFVRGSKVQFGDALVAQGVPELADPDPASITASGGTQMKVQVPSFAVDGALTIIRPDGKTLTSDASKGQGVHLFNFRNTDAFNFKNFDFDISFPMVSNVFGDDATHVTVLGEATPVPDPFALAFTAILEGALGGKGACFGMALMADQLLHHPDQIGAGYGLPDTAPQATVYNLAPNGDLIAEIERKLLVQASGQFLGAVAHQSFGSQEDLFSFLQQDLQGGDFPLISMKESVGDGHTVLAYGLERTADGGFDILVGDSNRPFGIYNGGNAGPSYANGDEQTVGYNHWMAEDASRVHIKGDEWTYTMDYFDHVGNYDYLRRNHWEGKIDGGLSNGFAATPYNVIPEHPTLPYSLDGLADLIFGATDSVGPGAGNGGGNAGDVPTRTVGNLSGLPAAFVSSTGQLTINGFVLGSDHTSISLSTSATRETVVTVNGQEFRYAAGVVKSVTIYGGYGDGNIDLASVASGLDVTVYNAAGNKVVNVGSPGGSQDAIQGNVSIIGGIGQNTVNVNDRGAADSLRSGTGTVSLQAIANVHMIDSQTSPGSLPASVAPPSPPATQQQPVTAALVPVKLKGKTRLHIRISSGGVVKGDLVSPFQKPAYSIVAVTAVDTDGDGVTDSVLVLARKGKTLVRQTITA